MNQRERFDWLAEELPDRTGEELYNLAAAYYGGRISKDDPDFELAVVLYRYDKLGWSCNVAFASAERRGRRLRENGIQPPWLDGPKTVELSDDLTRSDLMNATELVLPPEKEEEFKESLARRKNK